jgi:hypothetical protein
VIRFVSWNMASYLSRHRNAAAGKIRLPILMLGQMSIRGQERVYKASGWLFFHRLLSIIINLHSLPSVHTTSALMGYGLQAGGMGEREWARKIYNYH